jgi:hypothetical protein
MSVTNTWKDLFLDSFVAASKFETKVLWIFPLANRFFRRLVVCVLVVDGDRVGLRVTKVEGRVVQIVTCCTVVVGFTIVVIEHIGPIIEIGWLMGIDIGVVMDPEFRDGKGVVISRDDGGVGDIEGLGVAIQKVDI